MESLEESLGIPLPAATQCAIVTEAAAAIRPAMAELIRHAAQNEVLHNDDTSMPVLTLRRDARHEDVPTEDDAAERTGVFTSGIVSTAQGQNIRRWATPRLPACQWSRGFPRCCFRCWHLRCSVRRATWWSPASREDWTQLTHE